MGWAKFGVWRHVGGSPSLQRGKQQDSTLQVLLSPNQLCCDRPLRPFLAQVP